VKTVGTNL